MFGNLTMSLHSNIPQKKSVTFGNLLRTAGYQSNPLKPNENQPAEIQQTEESLKALQKDTRSWVEQ